MSTPEQRAKKAAEMRAYYEANPEALKRKRAKEREKYRTNREHREKMKARARLDYEQNPERAKERNQARLARRVPEGRKKALSHLGGKCQTCGFDHPAALQFHHRDPATKAFDVAGNHFAKRWDVLLKEIEKCDLLCANCHCIIHYSHRAV